MIPPPIRRLARAARKYELTWRYGYNLGPSVQQRLKSPPLSPEAERVLRDLDRDGIAITHVDALLRDPVAYGDLTRVVQQLQHERAEAIAAARAGANDPTVGKKTFLMEYLGRNPTLDPDGAYARMALHPALLGLANAYLGMYSRMRYYNVWHTFASAAKARESQLWHRDREDLYIVKVFIYLGDVDLGAGPFTYAPGTHRKGQVRQDPAYFLEGRVKRTEDAQMAAVVPQDRWITATGTAGTIVVADTNGYHRGGLARTSDRVMFTCMYTSQASESEEFFVRPQTGPARARDAAAFALGCR